MTLKKYPKIKNLGDRMLTHLFDDEVEISEKMDGSQFRIHLNQELIFDVGSKNQIGLELFKSRIEMTKSNSKHDMFDLAVKEAEKLKPKLEIYLDGIGADYITLYIEYLRNKKHNALNYNRVPLNNLYLFGTTYFRDDKVSNMQTSDLTKLAIELGIESPNILYEGKIKNQEDLKKLLEIESVLGGTKIEGIVIKNYNKTYPADLLSTEQYVGFPLSGKLVRDEYREIQQGEWNKQKKKGSIDEIEEIYLTNARFMKSIQHLRDENKLTFEKKDLAILIPEVLNDLLLEEKDNIDKIILNKFYEQFRRRISNFVVTQYTEYLLSKQFENE